MPTFHNHYYDLRPKRPGWEWTAFRLDKITPIGRGTADTKAEAEAAVSACIERFRENTDGGHGAP
jgi:hypothetical protein